MMVVEPCITVTNDSNKNGNMELSITREYVSYLSLPRVVSTNLFLKTFIMASGIFSG